MPTSNNLSPSKVQCKNSGASEDAFHFLTCSVASDLRGVQL